MTVRLPPDVSLALECLQQLAPDAGISGGYLRDMVYGKQPKDIDVFCSKLTPESLLCLLVLFPDAKQEAYSAWLDYATGEVDSVWDLGLVDGLPFQLIVLKEGLVPADRYRFNDFGICQLWHDGTQLTTTSAFQMDAVGYTFTLCHCESEHELNRSMRRWDRLKKKYPDHELVIPERFQQWVK